jgi:hypothetical protein
MLLEAAIYCLSLIGAPKRARPHLATAVGLWARGRRHARAWAPHLAATKHAIEGAAARLPTYRTVVVLGSGPLFDIPLKSLAFTFDRVILVDLVHLYPARRRARSFPNVELVWRDLMASQERPDPLAFLRSIGNLDLVVSANLVSQLAAGAQEGIERRVVDAHLDGLLELECRVTLVTDLTYTITDRAEAVVQEFDLLYGRTMPEPVTSWTWTVAPFGEEGQTQRVHSVARYPDWTTASGRGNDFIR